MSDLFAYFLVCQFYCCDESHDYRLKMSQLSYQLLGKICILGRAHYIQHICIFSYMY